MRVNQRRWPTIQLSVDGNGFLYLINQDPFRRLELLGRPKSGVGRLPSSSRHGSPVDLPPRRGSLSLGPWSEAERLPSLSCHGLLVDLPLLKKVLLPGP